MLPRDAWMITLSFHRKYLKLRGRLPYWVKWKPKPPAPKYMLLAKWANVLQKKLRNKGVCSLKSWCVSLKKRSMQWQGLAKMLSCYWFILFHIRKGVTPWEQRVTGFIVLPVLAQFWSERWTIKNNSLYSVAKTKDSLQSQSVNSKGPKKIAHKHEELYTSDKVN